MGENFCKCPTLELGNRLGLNYANAVADCSFALFVMHVVFLGAFDDLVELRVWNAGDVLDDDGLLHFRRDDDADTGLAFMDCRCGFLG